MITNLKKNYQQILNTIDQRANLLIVSKNKSVDEIGYLYSLGQRDFGENKVQELAEKAFLLKDLDINWHFIGNLQANKINKLIEIQNLRYIHSLSSKKLISEFAKKDVKDLHFFLQINTSNEQEKSGFAPLELSEAIELSKSLNVIGLMTIGKIRSDNFELDAKKSFLVLKELKSRYNKDYQLSMGMSQDFQWALEFETDWVRIGSKVFE